VLIGWLCMGGACAEETTYPLTASGLSAYAEAQVGSGYIFGAYGQLCTARFRNGRAELYPNYADLIWKFGEQWDGRAVYDCIGLFKAFAIQGQAPALWEDINVSKAFQLWTSAYGPLEGARLQPGMTLFRMEGSRKLLPHIGIYVGDGWCVHARGTRWGVIKERMPSQFTHWARLNWVEYDTAMEETCYTQRPWLDTGMRALIDTDDLRDAPVFAVPVEAGKRKTNIGNFPCGTVVVVLEVPDEMSRRVTGMDAQGRTLTGYVRLTALSIAP
ncbi:MAG: hypothetical protein RR482_02120, partial [Clostridia bacterium]